MPAVLIEQRVVIGTEMARGTLPANGVVEHAAEAGAIDRPALPAESDEAAGELVHDHEDPVALEHDGLAAKQVHAPQAVRRVSDERQPRGSGSVRRRSVVFRQDAIHDVLVDIEPERLGDDARNPRTSESRIARLKGPRENNFPFWGVEALG